MKTQNPASIIAAIAMLTLLSLIVAGCALAQAQPTVAPNVAQPQNVPPTPKLDRIEVDTSQMPDLKGQSDKSSCPKVTGPLAQIVAAADPSAAAAQLGFKAQDDKIQVLITLNGEDAGVLQEQGIEIGSQVGNKVQAWVPIRQICDLASSEQVSNIQLPAPAMIP